MLPPGETLGMLDVLWGRLWKTWERDGSIRYILCLLLPKYTYKICLYLDTSMQNVDISLNI